MARPTAFTAASAHRQGAAGSRAVRKPPRRSASHRRACLGVQLLLIGATLASAAFCPAPRLRRRELVPLSLLSALALAPAPARSEQQQVVIGGPAPPQDLLLISPYAPKVQRLRSVVQNSGELVNILSTQGVGGSFSGGSVDAVRERLERGKREVLLPLQQDLAGAVERLAPTLAGEERQKLEALPGLLQGHLLELDDALVKGLMAEYTDKNGKVYKCGRVERELEEVCETVDEFLRLVGQGAPPSA